MSVILDTGPLIVVLQSQCKFPDETAIERHRVHRAKVIHFLDGQTSPFIVPALCFTEFLVGLPEEYKEYIFGLPKKFRVAPLTGRVAVIASRIKMTLMNESELEDISKKYGQTKNCISTDLHLLAFCEAEGKKRLLTRDRPLSEKAARLNLPCTLIDDLPDPPEPIPPKPSATDPPSLFFGSPQ